jgi:hypothetical protein
MVALSTERKGAPHIEAYRLVGTRLSASLTIFIQHNSL